jgi:hypothetical protein
MNGHLTNSPTGVLTGWWNRLSPAVRFSLALTLGLRVGLSAWAALALTIVPLGPIDPALLYLYHGATPIVDGAAGLWLGAWQRWDAVWYMRIVEQGYHAGNPSLVFPPLYPILTRVVSALPGVSPLLGGMLVSTMSAFVAFIFLYRLALGDIGEAAAGRTVVYLAIFPWAYFLMAPYSESLFLATTLSAFFFARQRRWWLAGLLGAAAALTRVQGVLLLLPLGYETLVQSRSQGAGRGGERLAYFRQNASPLALIPLAPACFAGYLYFAIGDQTLWGSLGGDIWNLHFAFPWEGVAGSVLAIVQGSPPLLPPILDLAVTALFGILTVLAFRRLGVGPGLYMAAMLLVPMTKITADDRLMSMTRYVLVLYPGFMLLALAGERPWVNRFMVYTSIALLGFFTAIFVHWVWTG